MKEQPGEQWPATGNIHLELLSNATVALVDPEATRISHRIFTVNPIAAGICEIENLRPRTHTVKHQREICRYQSQLTNQWAPLWPAPPVSFHTDYSARADKGLQKWTALWKPSFELLFHVSAAFCPPFGYGFFPIPCHVFLFICFCPPLCGCWCIFWESGLVKAGYTTDVWSPARKNITFKPIMQQNKHALYKRWWVQFHH